MTIKVKTKIGAASASNNWNTMKWDTAAQEARRLQMRIAKATREGRHSKAKALQWLLTHSFYAKALAVKRVVQNDGKRTPGVDKIIWKTPRQKIEAIKTLQRHGYQPQPLRRIYIPKKNGKQRPLGIPTMKDRAMQALHAMALEPIAENKADPNSYGFRAKRSTADAIGHCFYALARSYAPTWILEGDIKACFDRIDHSWLLTHTPMDKVILNKWLTAGYKEEGNRHFAAAEYDTAAAAYTEALRFVPSDPGHAATRAVYWSNRAACALHLEKLSAALYDCDRALEEAPAYVKALTRRATVLERLGKLDEAVKGV